MKSKLTWLRIVRNWQLYVMIAPAILMIFIFNYIPMAGAQVTYRAFPGETATLSGGGRGEPLP